MRVGVGDLLELSYGSTSGAGGMQGMPDRFVTTRFGRNVAGPLRRRLKRSGAPQLLADRLARATYSNHACLLSIGITVALTSGSDRKVAQSAIRTRRFSNKAPLA